MPRRDYSPKNYNSFAEAYVAYWDDRHSEIKTLQSFRKTNLLRYGDGKREKSKRKKA